MMRSVLITEMDSSSVNAAASSAEKSIFYSNACQQSCHFACRSDSYKSDYNRSLQHGGYVFIGQMNDPNQVAAATISMPLFIFMTALANLFGIGGASLISRSLGIGNRKKLHHALHSAFGRRQVPLCSTELQYSFFVPVCCP